MDSGWKYLNPFTLGPIDLQYWFTKFHEDQEKRGCAFNWRNMHLVYTKDT